MRPAKRIRPNETFEAKIDWSVFPCKCGLPADSGFGIVRFDVVNMSADGELVHPVDLVCKKCHAAFLEKRCKP